MGRIRSSRIKTGLPTPPEWNRSEYATWSEFSKAVNFDQYYVASDTPWFAGKGSAEIAKKWFQEQLGITFAEEKRPTTIYVIAANLNRERGNAVRDRIQHLQITTPASQKCDPRVLSFKYTAVGTLPNTRLQFDRFNFSDESLVVVGKERTDHIEHGVTEATDVHDVGSLTSLNRLVRLQIDVN